MKLKCNGCENNQNGYCLKLKEALPNGYAMMYYGGVVDNEKYKGTCGK